MLKQIKTVLANIFSKKWVLAIIAVIVLLVMYAYSNNKYHIRDRMTTGDTLPNSNISPSNFTGDQNMDKNKTSNYALQPVANPEDLLPKDSNSQWTALNPVLHGNVAVPDLLQSGYHIGIDTVGQTNKNPNYQLRSDPVIEKRILSPWNQSTIEADISRIPLEFGIETR
jgi:hypothetical protein